MKRPIGPMLFAIAAAPVSFVVTFLLIPLWRWFEHTAAVEAVGHSGPATWCSVMVYLLILGAGISLRRRLRHRSGIER